EEIRVREFKTFRELSLKLDPYNVIIGINAAGKSNFIDIFRFLKDIASRGLQDAISLQGGAECLRNLCYVSEEPLSIEVRIDCRSTPLRFMLCLRGGASMDMAVKSWLYRLEIPVIHSQPPIVEVIEAEGDFGTVSMVERTAEVREGKIRIFRERDGVLKVSISPEEVEQLMENPAAPGSKFSGGRSILEDPFCIPSLAFLIHSVGRFFANMGIYDMDPNLARRLAITGPASLEPDGSNLTIALEHLLKDERKKEEFVTLLNDILPFIKDVDMEIFQGFSPMVALREAYCEGILTPAYLLSAGTVHLTMLLLILYFEERNPVILEEPGRNIHPFLASRIVEWIRDVSMRLDKQVIFTTHHPTIVKHTADRLLVVKRDSMGYSCILRPLESQEVKAYLDFLGIEDLFVQNLL
uniref:AAA family ATPase n=1 Tax=Methanothrix sp. TaxID=90426 RepID=UPI0034E21634